jgi:hypothetical protein
MVLLLPLLLVLVMVPCAATASAAAGAEAGNSASAADDFDEADEGTSTGELLLLLPARLSGHGSSQLKAVQVLDSAGVAVRCT